jgi:multidrug efflux pump subunit AcrA (membrane-fusion protein)
MRLLRSTDAVPEERSVEKSELLKQLHIDRSGVEPPRPRVRWFILVGCVLLVVAAGLLWFALTAPASPTVRTAVARAAGHEPVAHTVLDASGYVTARRQATVSAKITGKVAEVLIEEGVQVKEGDVLARLDDTEARAQLALARAQLSATRAQLAEIRTQLAQAERDYARQQGLAERQLISTQALEDARTQRDMLRARLASTEEQGCPARYHPDPPRATSSAACRRSARTASRSSTTSSRLLARWS